MIKKSKYVLITIISIVMLSTMFLGLSTQYALAFSGVADIQSEKELYNATNTYNVKNDIFTDTGVFSSTRDEDRITEKTQYNIAYDMTEKNNNQVMDNAQITVLTHGLGSNAGVWSNDFSADTKTENFAYDTDSLISQIVEKVGVANIYWAMMTDYNDFNLYDITAQTGEYSNSNNFKVDNITDISRHIIIVFDAYKYEISPNNYHYTSYESNNNIYYQFNYMLSKIIYDVKDANGGILPKVNLVGHSRGGLTNLQYALDHPDLVSTLVSLGTPYFSSTTANLFGEMFMNGPSDGLNDILNPDIYYDYNKRWNQNYNTLYSDIDVYAMGSYHTLAALVEVLGNDYSGMISERISDEGVVGVSAILGAINGYMISPLGFLLPERIVVSAITEILDIMYPDSQIVDVAEILFQELNYDVYPMFVSWYNDILVNLESQLGTDTGAVGYEYSGSYLGFNRMIRPFLMFDDYVDYEKVSQASAPVGHNLIARDQLVIAEIVSVLDLGVNSDSAYVTIENEDNTVTFVRYRGEYSGSVFYVPETIDGKTVTEISAFAFDGETNITEIVLPKTIKKISAYAFAGLENLTTISFAGSGTSQLEKIVYGAFAGCENLTKFNSTSAGTLDMPASVEFVDCYAFYGTGFTTIELGANIDYIGDVAFSNITGLTGISVSDNSKYFSDGGALFNSDGWLMQYPVGKSNTSYEIPSSVSNVDIRHISQFAFMGENNLETINLNNVISIDSYAFMGCTSLETFNNASNVEYVGPFALDDTSIMQGIGDFVTLGKVLYRYSGTASVLNASNFPTGVTRISSNAFCCNDYVEKIYLPNNIADIDNNAFVDCANLEEIIYYRTTLPDVGNYSFVSLPNTFKFYCRKALIDSLSATSNWYNQSDMLSPIATEVYFEDIEKHVTFYFGEDVVLPTEEIPGLYLKGWLRVNESTNQTYGNYLTPGAWNETISTAIYRADAIIVEKYTMYFYNGDTQISVLDISTGDEFSITKTGYTLNGESYTFAKSAEMTNCAYDEYYGPSVVDGQTIAIFEGWLLDGDPVEDGQWLDCYSDYDLCVYAYWEPVWFTATVYDGYSSTRNVQFNYCDGLSLEDPTRSGYMFKEWKNNGTSAIVSMPLRTTSNVSLTAQWVQIYTITYKNLTFMGQTAEVIWDDNMYEEAPSYYKYDEGLDLSRASAFWQADTPYDAQLVFLGWYTNKNFTTKVTSISTNSTGNKTYYAKWRYDSKQITRYEDYTITDDDPYADSYDRISLELGYNNLLVELKNIGINYIYLEFKLRIEEVNDGYQEVLLYKDSTGERLLWEATDIDHQEETAVYYIWHLVFDIGQIALDEEYNAEEVQVIKYHYIYVRYGAHGGGADTWTAQELQVDVMYTVDNDCEKYIEEFSWDYSSVVDDSLCVPLENVSESFADS